MLLLVLLPRRVASACVLHNRQLLQLLRTHVISHVSLHRYSIDILDDGSLLLSATPVLYCVLFCRQVPDALLPFSLLFATATVHRSLFLYVLYTVTATVYFLLLLLCVQPNNNNNRACLHHRLQGLQ
jgi:hypothetical protein